VAAGAADLVGEEVVVAVVDADSRDQAIGLVLDVAIAILRVVINATNVVSLNHQMAAVAVAVVIAEVDTHSSNKLMVNNRAMASSHSNRITQVLVAVVMDRAAVVLLAAHMIKVAMAAVVAVAAAVDIGRIPIKAQ